MKEHVQEYSMQLSWFICFQISNDLEWGLHVGQGHTYTAIGTSHHNKNGEVIKVKSEAAAIHEYKAQVTLTAVCVYGLCKSSGQWNIIKVSAHRPKWQQH